MKYKHFKLLKNKIFKKSSKEGVISVKKKTDSLYILLKNDENDIFVEEIDKNDNVRGKSLDNFRLEYRNSISLNKDDLQRYSLVIHYFYKSRDIEYTSIYSLFFGYYLRFDKMRIGLVGCLERIGQTIYDRNKNNFITLKRIDFLKLAINKSLNKKVGSSNSVICLADIITASHTISVWSSSRHQELCNEYILIAQSLVDSGELEKIDPNSYSITGKALKTISDYEVEERRHGDMMLVSRVMLFVTAILALFTILDFMFKK